jgi:hypothetical protein
MKLFVAALASFLLIAGGVPASSQSAYTAFGFKPSRDLTVPAVADTEVTTLLQTLDKLLAAPPAGTAGGSTPTACSGSSAAGCRQAV